MTAILTFVTLIVFITTMTTVATCSAGQLSLDDQHVCDTGRNLDDWQTGRSVVGNGEWWSVKEVITHLKTAGRPVSDTTVRSMLAKDYLRGWYTEPGHHARIEPASVDDLIPILRMRLGAERDAALDALARRNRSEAE
jgi:hypothetical protein